jgi:hypothetical protein
MESIAIVVGICLVVVVAVSWGARCTQIALA